MRNEVVLDLETKSAPQSWGARDALGELGVSVVGIWSSRDDQFRIFREGELVTLGPILRAADRLIGFALQQFDLPVLQPYLDVQLSEIPALDMFEEVTATLGHRVSLASLAKATLGASKLGHGLDAVRWYQAGEWGELEAYCLQDVRLTRDLYRFGAEHGHLLFESYVDGKTVAVPVRWGMADEREVQRLIERARDEERVIEIDYVSREDAGQGFRKTRKIEVRSLVGDDVQAYDHLRGEVRSFRLGRIAGARLLEERAGSHPVAQSLFSGV